MVLELFLDSLIPAPHLPEKGSLLDVGTGAGFPGLPLKIYYPNLGVTLLESKNKKVSFLHRVIFLLGLDGIEVLEGRLEDSIPLLRGEGYDVVTARALFGFEKTIQWCAPLLAPGGILLCFLGQGAEKILARGQGCMEDFHLTLHHSMPYLLPGRDSSREVIILRKGSDKKF
jgi:16S rRNA (guanine527-N7)-methyltransferase